MRYIDELEIEEVAKMLEVTPNAVYVRVHRALKSLKEVMTEKP
jgi:DNA-directed RNA polymerase specialized sigma24 family protein